MISTIPENIQECKCNDWVLNINKIDDPIMFLALNFGSKGYTGVLFRYCPWCGKKLKEVSNAQH